MTDCKPMMIWDQVKMTDPEYTKGFTRGGGFKGTAIDALYNIQRATELWGPMGVDWGCKVIDEQYVTGSPGDIIHVIRVLIWFPFNGKRGEIEAYGQTQFAGKRASGQTYTDEEAPKKSLTDALTKGLSWLGFSADVHMGLFDDNKYVREATAAFAASKRKPNEAAATTSTVTPEASDAFTTIIDKINEFDDLNLLMAWWLTQRTELPTMFDKKTVAIISQKYLEKKTALS